MFSLSRIKNAAGEMRGFGSCGICGDSWAWKEIRDIPTDPAGVNGVFPVCRDCYESGSAVEIIAALYRLQAEWALDSDSLARLQRNNDRIQYAVEHVWKSEEQEIAAARGELAKAAALKIDRLIMGKTEAGEGGE